MQKKLQNKRIKGEKCMLRKKLSVALLATTVLGMGATTQMASAVEYNGATNATTDVKAEIKLPDSTAIEIPPVDPDGPGIPPDIKPNPELGDGLAIMYVSDLNFGISDFNQTEETKLVAASDSVGGVNFDNMVTITDIRSEDSRDGWELRVTQDNELFSGGSITMNPTVDSNNSNGVTVVENELALNNESQRFASADNSMAGQAGTTSIGMGEVSLVIPAGTGVGTYNSTLTWNLVAGPGQS